MPDARLGERGRRCSAGGVAATRRLRRPHRQPGRMADHGRGTALPGRAARPPITARGAVARAAGGRCAGRDRPGAGGAAGRLRRSRAAGRARYADSRRAARLRAARHVRRTVRGDRHHPRPLPRCREDARQPDTPPGPASAGPRDEPHRRCQLPRCVTLRTRHGRGATYRRRGVPRGLEPGDFDALLAVLDPDATVRADAAAVPAGAPRRLSGAQAVAQQALAFSHRTPYARVALVDGASGIAIDLAHQALWNPPDGAFQIRLVQSDERRDVDDRIPR